MDSHRFFKLKVTAVLVMIAVCTWAVIRYSHQHTGDKGMAVSQNHPHSTVTSSSTQASSSPTWTPPAGTPVVVSLEQAIGSKISEPGQRFTAKLAKPVKVGGETLIPAGADVFGTVTETRAWAEQKGKPTIALRLDAIDVGGTKVPLNTYPVSLAKYGNTVRVVDRGEKVGGLLGKVDHGQVVASYDPKEIVLPAETPLSFTSSASSSSDATGSSQSPPQ